MNLAWKPPREWYHVHMNTLCRGGLLNFCMRVTFDVFGIVLGKGLNEK